MVALLEAIAQIIQRFPGRPAILDEQQALTFADLRDNAQLIGAFLRENGVTAGDTVAVCLPRTAMLPATLYAILSNDNSYVFLDPVYPTARLQYYLDTAEPKILLTNPENIDRFQISKNVCLPVLPSSMTTPVQDSPLPSAIAYIMFTSGSTGVPKGIKINHARLNRYLNALSSRMGLSSSDIYLHTASFSFSSSVRQFLLPLRAGCTQYIASAKTIADPLQLADCIMNNDITVIDTTPSYWPHALNLIEEKGDVQFLGKSSVRLLAFSGSILHYDLVNDFKIRSVYRGDIMNIYGHTETIGVASYILPHDTQDNSGIVPIGQVYDDIDFLIEDGQLTVAMPGLTNCYVNYPSNAFQYRRYRNDEKLFFQTGDVGREQKDGILEIRGRTDDQVKINGVRVELAEIEAVLQEDSGVNNAVVIFQDGRLNAYITLAPQSSSTEKQLLDHASHKLISWMLPSELRLLENFPKLPNAKIDKMAFRRPSFYDNARKSFSDTFTQRRCLFYDRPPTTPLNDSEQKLLSIWQQLLSRERLSPEDNFFQVGGDSLLAMELLLAIEKKLEVTLSIENIYSYPTIRALAHWISSKTSTRKTPAYNWAFWIQQKDSAAKTLFWCGHFKAALRTSFKAYNIVAFKSYYSPWNTLSCHPESVEELATYYLKDIKNIQPTGPYYLAGFSGEGVFAYEVARQLTKEGEKVAVFLLDPSRLPQLLSTYGKLRYFLSYLRIDRLPVYINYRLFRKNVVRRMFLGDSDYQNVERSKELLTKYTIVRIRAAFYLIQTPIYIKRTHWRDFLAESCVTYRFIPATHVDLINQEKVTQQWVSILKEMLQTDLV